MGMRLSRYKSMLGVTLSLAEILSFQVDDSNGFTTRNNWSNYAKVQSLPTQVSHKTAVTIRRPFLNAKGATKTTTKTQLSMVGSATSIAPKLVIRVAALVLSTVLASTGFVKLFLDKPSRTYGSGTVAQEYDEWTEEGILEYYCGEDVKYRYKPLKEAQYSFIDEMMKFGGIDPVTDGKAKVLDVGCGFGGTSRYLARALGPESTVTAITLSPKQVERAKELAIEQNTPNVDFMVEDALEMPSFP